MILEIVVTMRHQAVAQAVGIQVLPGIQVHHGTQAHQTGAVIGK